VARHEGAKHIMGQALASTPGTRVRLEPLGHQTSRRNDIQVFSLLGSQATGLANAEYDLTVVSLANKDARATKLPNQDTDPSRLANKYLDSVYVFELGPSKRIFRDSNPDLRCVTITLNTRGSIANKVIRSQSEKAHPARRHSAQSWTGLSDDGQKT
jgi:hypothetical protein